MKLHTYLKIKSASVKRAASTAGRLARELPAELAMLYPAAKGDFRLPAAAILAATGGRVAGGLSSSKDLERLAKDNIAVDFIPGVAGYKMQKQKRVLENMLRKKKRGNKTMSEILGRYTSQILPYFAGGAIGGQFGKDLFEKYENQEKGFKLADRLTNLANLGGALATNLTKGRSKKDLEKYYNSGIGTTLGNYLIPGMGAYNDWKNSVAADRIMSEFDDDMELPDPSEIDTVPTKEWADFDEL